MIKIDLEREIINLVKSVRNKFESNLSKEDLAYQICKEYGVEVREDYLNTDSDGHYISESNSIILNKNCTYKPRTIFTLFHEILHFLIEKEGAKIIELLTEHSRNTYKYSLERLCDLGASEFLLPEEQVEESLNGEINSVSFRKLLESYEEISAPAIARKLAYLAHYPAIFIICGKKLLNIPSGGLLEEDQRMWEKLAIEYAFSTSTFDYRLKRFQPIPETHLIQQAFDKNEGCNGDDLFPFSNPKTKWKCYIECFLYGNRAYGILYKSKPINNENQLSLL